MTARGGLRRTDRKGCPGRLFLNHFWIQIPALRYECARMRVYFLFCNKREHKKQEQVQAKGLCGCVFLTSSNSVLRAPNSHVARYVYAFNLNPLWWCLAQQRGRDGRIHAQCFIDDRFQVNQGGNVLVRYIRVGIRHVRSELVAQLLDLFRVSGKFEHDVSQSCGGGIAMIPSWLASCSTKQRLLIQDQLIFTFHQ